jgi:hypothetical protein
MFRDTGPSEAQKKAAAAARVDASAAQACETATSDLAASLDSLHEGLSTSGGMTFSDYSSKVDSASTAYDSAGTSNLSPRCHDQVAEQFRLALNNYIDANNTWKDCLNNFYCSTSSIDPQLQDHWSSATDQIKAGEDNTTSWLNSSADTLVQAEKALKD